MALCGGGRRSVGDVLLDRFEYYRLYAQAPLLGSGPQDLEYWIGQFDGSPHVDSVAWSTSSHGDRYGGGAGLSVQTQHDRHGIAWRDTIGHDSVHLV
jgi:hypothetical protein